MKAQLFFLLISLFAVINAAYSASSDSLIIHNLGHASVMLEFEGKVIHIDPRASEADYANLPDADIICITHGHGDHYNMEAINLIDKTGTMMVLTQAVKDLNSYKGETRVMNNGDSINLEGIAIEAVHAYNLDDGSGTVFHPKGVGNGYIFTFKDLRVYLAGDTHNIPEMADFDVDIAFIPMNLPYTMTPDMAAEAAKVLHPKIVYIYHYDASGTNALKEMLKDEKMEIRIGESKFIESTKGGGTSSLLPVLNNNKCLIYPNPSKGLITVEQQAPIADLLVYNMQGKLLVKKCNLEAGCNPVDLQMLHGGHYLLEVNSKKSYSVRQLFVLLK